MTSFFVDVAFIVALGIVFAVGYVIGIYRIFTTGDRCEMDGCRAITAPDAHFCTDHRAPGRIEEATEDEES